MAVQFRKAERKKAKLRLGLSGASGSGKTFTALKVAFGLGQRVAVIDTENGSADLYAHLGDYDVLQLQAPYTPEKFTEAIWAAEQAGYGTIIIDSLSHAWSGEGGVLEIKDNIGSSFQAWKTVTPRHNALVEAMLQSKCHIIATMRAKAEYVVSKNEKGKDAPTKVGLAPIQREGMEYEFTVFLDLSADHVATASKDRTGLIDQNPVKNPDERLGKRLLEWLEVGTSKNFGAVTQAGEDMGTPPADTASPGFESQAAPPIAPKEGTPWDVANRRLRAVANAAAKAENLAKYKISEALKNYIGGELGLESSKECSPDQLHYLADLIEATPGYLTILAGQSATPAPAAPADEAWLSDEATA